MHPLKNIKFSGHFTNRPSHSPFQLNSISFHIQSKPNFVKISPKFSEGQRSDDLLGSQVVKSNFRWNPSAGRGNYKTEEEIEEEDCTVAEESFGYCTRTEGEKSENMGRKEIRARRKRLKNCFGLQKE